MQLITPLLELVGKLAAWQRVCGLLMTISASAATPVAFSPDAPAVIFGPPGSWVKPQFANHSTTAALDPSGEDHVLLLEQQINAVQDERFTHEVRQILSLAGVQKDATLNLDFNPGYQSLTLHWARIWRGAEHLDRLDTNAVKVVQPERDLNQYILNGRKSVILVLDDVRVGDIINFAYSIKGKNPVFGGHFSAAVPVQMLHPAERLLTRVVWPTQRRLYARTHGCTVQPVLVPGKDVVEYLWDVRQSPGVVAEDLLPMWCDPEPWVQLSEFKTWAEVNQWAMALFQTNASLSPELTRRIAEWQRLPSPEQQILSALRFVQDEVRYFGIEIGASTAKPADPSVVFARRFGDCKDKSLLFVAILRALRIESYPGLVNATLGRAIQDWQPTDDAFDHCIAVVRCDGQTYWLDPTMNYQRGSLAAHSLPNYDCGLVISPQTVGLSPIPHATGLPYTTTVEYFQVRGKSEPTTLKVVTTCEGGDAENLRRLFAETKHSEIEKSYTHFYSDLYAGIKLSAPIATEDDMAQNRFRTIETYSIDNAWSQPDKARKIRFEFYPSTIAALLKKPVDTERILPLGVNFPRHQTLRTEVTLPETWPAESSRQSVSDPAFLFQKAYQCAGNKLVMEYDYQALTDSVSPDRMAEYITRVNQSTHLLGYSLSWR